MYSSGSYHHFTIHQRIYYGRDVKAILTSNARGKLMIRENRPELDQWTGRNQ